MAELKTTTKNTAPDWSPLAGQTTQTTTSVSGQGLKMQTTTVKEPTEKDFAAYEKQKNEYGTAMTGGAADPAGHPDVEPPKVTETTTTTQIPNPFAGMAKAAEQGPPMEYPTGLSGGAVWGTAEQRRQIEADDARRQREREQAAAEKPLFQVGHTQTNEYPATQPAQQQSTTAGTGITGGGVTGAQAQQTSSSTYSSQPQQSYSSQQQQQHSTGISGGGVEGGLSSQSNAQPTTMVYSQRTEPLVGSTQRSNDSGIALTTGTSNAVGDVSTATQSKTGASWESGLQVGTATSNATGPTHTATSTNNQAGGGAGLQSGTATSNETGDVKTATGTHSGIGGGAGLQTGTATSNATGPFETATATQSGINTSGIGTSTATNSSVLGSTATKTEFTVGGSSDDSTRRSQQVEYPGSSTARRF